MAEANNPQRENEPMKARKPIKQIDIEDYIEAMVVCERLAAENLDWSEAEWAAHCIQQNAIARGGK